METPECENLKYYICYAKAVGLYECDRYLKTRGRVYTLCPVFGRTQSSISDWLHYSLTVLEIVVTDQKHILFAINCPTAVEMEASSQLLQNNRPYGRLLRSVFAVTDGARMPCAEFTDPGMQNAYYEGCTQSVEVTNLFVWNIADELIHAAINFPGSWHDSHLASASGLYWPMLSDENTPPGYAIIGDSAFANNYRMKNGKVIRAKKTNEMWDVPQGENISAIDLIMQRVMPSEHQSPEWGVRALKDPFGRLTVPLPADAYKRCRIGCLCCHLFNMRTRTVSRNHIRATYGTQYML